MTSRAGSLIVAVFLGGVTLLAILLILFLTGDDDAPEGDTLLDLSLREGDVVLVGEPVELRVTARDDEPVTRVELSVDGVLTSGASPVEDPATGRFSATLSWVPDREGTVTVEVEALSLSGRTTTVEVRVEVTANAALVRSAPRLTIVSPTPLQRVAVGEELTVLVQAQSTEPVTEFRLEVDSAIVDTRAATPEQSNGELVILQHTPVTEGIVVLRVRATTDGGTESIAEVTVEAVPGEETADDETSLDEVTGEDGILSIVTPEDGDEIEFAEGLEIPVEIQAFETGELQSIELYVNTVLTQSVRVDPRSDGSYVLTLPFRPGTAGVYALEAVAISTRSQRFDSRVDITILPAEDDAEPPPDEEPPDEEPAPTPLPDLTPRSLAAGEGNTVVVEVANIGSEPMGPAPVLFSVTRTADGLLVAEDVIVLALAAGESRPIPLTVGLTETIDITVIVDTAGAIEESDENNNTLSAVFEPLQRPDLVAQGLQLSADRLPIVSLVNAGSATAGGPIAVLILFEGQMVERLAVPQDLGPQGTLTLAGSQPIEGDGQLSAIVDPDNAIAESSEANNTITIAVTG